MLALLTWNTQAISLDSLRAYEQEALMLRRLGHQPLICVCDNGSTDGSQESLARLNESMSVPAHVILNDHNAGNSIARNQIIDHFLETGGDYLLFMDGDIEIVPFSSVAMLRYMENWGGQLGCIGADSAGQTPDRRRASRAWYAIDSQRVDTTNLVAWTQYGMFRRQVFEAGVRFDESHPFDSPGWGFEDNDLAFQMEMKGFSNQRFFGMVYLHRALRSSVQILTNQGVDAAELFNLRRQFVLEKWADVPPIKNGPLHYVRRVYVQL